MQITIINLKLIYVRFYIRKLKKKVIPMLPSDAKSLKTAQTLFQHRPAFYFQDPKLVSYHDNKIIPILNKKDYSKAQPLLKQFITTLQTDQQALSKKETHKNLSITHCYEMHVVFNNLALVNWKLKANEQTDICLQQSSLYLQMLIRQCQYKEQHIFFTIQLIKLSLQHCVVMSHGANHNASIQIIERVIRRLIEVFQVMSAVACDMSTSLKKMTPKQQRTMQQKGNKVDFKIIVITQARQKLEQLLGVGNWYRNIQKSKQQLKQTINKLYTWKTNLENNQKFIRMSLKIPNQIEQSHRNILGIQKVSDEVADFNIGVLMSMKPKQFKFQPCVDTFYLLSSSKIQQLVILTSAIFFTLATEIRFHEIDSAGQIMTLSQKFLKMNDNPSILKCKVLHLKAIQLVGKFLPASNRYISHLIDSFNKNYKFFMDQIKQQSSYLIDEDSGENQKIKRSKLKRERFSESRSKDKSKSPKMAGSTRSQGKSDKNKKRKVRIKIQGNKKSKNALFFFPKDKP